MQTVGLLGTILISCVVGILLGAAGIDLERLARMTAMLSWLTMLTFGVRAVYQHNTRLVTAIVGVGIAQGALFFLTDVDVTVLSIMFDAMAIFTMFHLSKKKSSK